MAHGYRWKVESFVCAATGNPLNFDCFYEKDGYPYTPEAYVDLFRACPACSKPVAVDDESVSP